MSRISNDWVCIGVAIPMNDAYLAYAYVDETRGTQDDPEAYGTLGRWRDDERERCPSVRFTVDNQLRYSWAPPDEAGFGGYDNNPDGERFGDGWDSTGSWSVDHGGSGS